MFRKKECRTGIIKASRETFVVNWINNATINIGNNSKSVMMALYIKRRVRGFPNQKNFSTLHHQNANKKESGE